MNVIFKLLIQSQQVGSPVDGWTESQRREGVRYIDEDGNPCQGWYSTVQAFSFERRWKLACVLVSCGFRVEAGF